MTPTAFLYAFDLCGTFLFALSGASRGVEKRLDIFGVAVLAFAASVSGGIARDVLLGATPPGAISDWRYLATAVVAALVVIFLPEALRRVTGLVVVFDAFGLGFFAVNGALKSLNAGLDPLMASVLGMITGVGGGIARDLLTMRVPMVLRADIYAVAALTGAAITAFGMHFGAPLWPTVIFGGVMCVAMRLTAWTEGWHLPPIGR